MYKIYDITVKEVKWW